MIKKLIICLVLFPVFMQAQINTDRVMTIARNALYFEDYVLSIQYFNQVINAKPYLSEPYFFRGLAKINLDDYQGAEEDCTEAIKRNPFVVSAYQVRGLARIRQNNYQGAIEDYKKALEYDPENINVWHNMILCEMQEENYQQAQQDLTQLIRIAPKYTKAVLMRGEVFLRQKDTLRAMQDFDMAVERDRYDGDAWSSRGMLKLQLKEYKEAESDLDQAIYLTPKGAGNYINRALARFHQNNLRGAMSDYDMALEVDPNNFIGYYNRGLLRAQVGDDNRAIEDFDKVIEMEPDNMMAIFNRALLLDQTGDYQAAIRDYSMVIEEYPNFVTGYYYRGQARRKIGDNKGAEADELFVLRSELNQINNASGTSGALADNAEEEEGDGTRKQSDRNMRNYGKIVVADNTEVEEKYKSEYRGKVQDRNVNITLEPMFVLTYYEKTHEVQRPVNYYKSIDELTGKDNVSKRILITNQETPLTEKQVEEHFNSIDEKTFVIVENPNDAKAYFARSIDFYLVQDLDNALADLTQAIVCDGSFFPAYFNRAIVRYKQLEYQKAEEELNIVAGSTMLPKPEVKALDYEIIKKDLDKVIDLVPDFIYAYYNRGNVYSMLKDYRAALVDYDRAISLNENFAEAYYNRGLTHIFLGNNRQGITDLSKAGELGIVSAYNVIKRFMEQSR